MSAITHPIAFVHPACGQVGIFMRAGLGINDPVRPEHFEHINGNPVEGHEPRDCDACGREFSARDLVAMIDPANRRPRAESIRPEPPLAVNACRQCEPRCRGCMARTTNALADPREDGHHPV